MKNEGRFVGTVISFKASMRFGFIAIKHEAGTKARVPPITDSEAFIHQKDIVSENKSGIRKLISGQIVEFDCYRNDQGYKAMNLVIIGDMFDEAGELNGNTVQL